MSAPLGRSLTGPVLVLFLAALAGLGLGPRGPRLTRRPDPMRHLMPGYVPTWDNDIAPLLQKHCASCHTVGGSAPFPLNTLTQARRRDAQIAEVLRSRYMPPWLPSAEGLPLHGDRRLSEDEIHQFEAWVAAGTPRGDTVAEVEVHQPEGDWRLGEPELVLRMAEPFRVPAEGPDIFRNLVIEVPLLGPRRVRAMEVRPGASRALHHAVITLDESRGSRELDARDPGPGFDGMMGAAQAWMPDGHFLGWLPGKGPFVAPAGMSWLLPARSDLVLQLHLKPTGKEEAAEVSIGLHFTDEPQTSFPVLLRLGSQELDLPAGDDDHRVQDSFTLPVDVELLSLWPHAHYLAVEMRVEAVLPGQAPRTVLHIPDWDLDWQDQYTLATPLKLPAGSELRMSYRFDNSEGNVRNPNHPPRRVLFGPRSEDEMADLWVQVLPSGEPDAWRLRQIFARHELEAMVRGSRFVIERSPEPEKRLQARFNLGIYLGRMERNGEAAEAFTEVLKLEPGNAMAHYNLGILTEREGQVDEALGHYRRALELEPANVESRYNLGRILLASSKLAEARSAFEEVLRQDPGYSAAHHNLGVIQVKEGDLGGAERSYRQALTLDPRASGTMNAMGKLAARRGDRREGIRWLEKSLEVDPRDADSRYNLALLVAQDGDLERARSLLQKLVQQGRASPRARRLLEEVEARQASPAGEAR